MPYKYNIVLELAKFENLFPAFHFGFQQQMAAHC